jgi:hypothetical protein
LPFVVPTDSSLREVMFPMEIVRVDRISFRKGNASLLVRFLDVRTMSQWCY